MICPRCDDNQAYKIFEAPEGPVWEVYRCPRCNFTWRSTEEDEVTNPKLVNELCSRTPMMVSSKVASVFGSRAVSLIGCMVLSSR